MKHHHLWRAHHDGSCGLSEIKYSRFHGFKFDHARCRFQTGEVVYDVMLNQTVSLRPCSTLAANSSLRTLQTTTTSTCSSRGARCVQTLTRSRYYLIQLLQNDDNPALFHVFKRWGRVGYSGGAARQDLKQHESAEEGVFA